jgi:hypothetical protein
VAEPEKALVDHCYLVARGWRKPLDADRLRLKNLDRKKINDYARLFKSKKMIGLLENIMSVKL